MPKLNYIGVRNLIITSIFALLVFASGYTVGRKGFVAEVAKPGKITINREIPANKDVDFALFWKVWDSVSTSYYDKSKIDPQKMTYGAIQGMVAAIGDPYTAFLPPSENKVVNEDLSGSFEGVGIQIGFKGTQLAVIAPLDGSPAKKAGIAPGDFIVGIKDELKKVERGTVGISLPEAVELIRGKAGTKVTLSLIREGEIKPIIVDVTREKIDVPSVSISFLKDKSVAHIKITKFGAETKAEWDEAVAQVIKTKETKAVILDLRGNPGGYLQSSVDIASEFIKSGMVVVKEEGTGESTSDYKVQRMGKLLDIPLVVLINGGSASASEILAGALRDDKRVKLIGETSFGKGTVQEPRDIENGAGIHITIAKWLTPNGTWVNEKGLIPDTVIKDDIATLEDEQLLEALKALGYDK